jgi:acetyltransferase-like isoleucine patch superfamily enzyme
VIRRASHGTGAFKRRDLAACGRGTVIEKGVLIFHPENVRIGANVYVGHQTILKGYYRNLLEIGDGTWIGPQAFIHSGGGVRIGRNVGVGPGVRVLTSAHRLDQVSRPILHSEIRFAPVVIEDGADIGAGAVLLPGVRIGRGAQVGAGAVVSDSVAAMDIVAGVPARRLRSRSAARRANSR